MILFRERLTQHVLQCLLAAYKEQKLSETAYSLIVHRSESTNNVLNSNSNLKKKTVLLSLSETDKRSVLASFPLASAMELLGLQLTLQNSQMKKREALELLAAEWSSKITSDDTLNSATFDGPILIFNINPVFLFKEVLGDIQGIIPEYPAELNSLSYIFSNKPIESNEIPQSSQNLIVEFEIPGLGQPFDLQSYLRGLAYAQYKVNCLRGYGYHVETRCLSNLWEPETGLLLQEYIDHGSEEELKSSPLEYMQMLLNSAKSKHSIEKGYEVLKILSDESSNKTLTTVWKTLFDAHTKALIPILHDNSITVLELISDELLSGTHPSRLEIITRLQSHFPLMQPSSDDNIILDLRKEDPQGPAPILINGCPTPLLVRITNNLLQKSGIVTFTPHSQFYPHRLAFTCLKILHPSSAWTPISYHRLHCSTPDNWVTHLSNALQPYASLPAIKMSSTRTLARSSILLNILLPRRQKDTTLILNDTSRRDDGTYLLYTYTRLCGIHRNTLPVSTEIDFSHLAMTPHALEIAIALSGIPYIMSTSFIETDTSLLLAGLMELCRKVSSGHNTLFVKGLGEVGDARRVLLESVRGVLGDVLRVVGAEPVERM